ncbi:MAG TPA: glycosyltransferase family 2 protein [Phycisphaerae bacterium]|nr:glycosyltransferase family 2 protein [Phycisphaerae bacterium]
MAEESRNTACDLSIVIPVYNEVDNVRPLATDVVRQADALNLRCEVIFVNDGSVDGTGRVLDELAEGSPFVKVIHFAANFGQTAALAAGIEAACGKNLVTMDGDRQNDPADIGPLLARLDEGYACVSGWRRDRQDSWLRRWPSMMANRLISRATSLPLHDYGCTIKAYRGDALDPSVLYGEMHRFLPVYVRARGGKVGEMVVRHHPRTAGKGKYGLSRTARVVADLALVRLLFKYRTRPVHLFAKAAQYLVLAAAVFGLLAVAQKIFSGAALLGGAFLTAVVLCVGAVLLVGVGLCCELVIRNHFYVLGRRPWRIGRRVNFDAAVASSDRAIADEEVRA